MLHFLSQWFAVFDTTVTAKLNKWLSEGKLDRFRLSLITVMSVGKGRLLPGQWSNSNHGGGGSSPWPICRGRVVSGVRTREQAEESCCEHSGLNSWRNGSKARSFVSWSQGLRDGEGPWLPRLSVWGRGRVRAGAGCSSPRPVPSAVLAVQ